MSAQVLLEERPCERVARLRLNRPSVLNALNMELRSALADAFTRLDADDSVRVIILAGNDQAFCAGADLNEYAQATPLEVIDRQMDRLWGAISRCRKPVIAAVRAHALGGGCELAMHSDFIIASTGARFGQPEVRLGLMPGGGATQRLTRAVGKFRAMKYLLTGDLICAKEALSMGLASEVVDDLKVEARAEELASQMANGPRVALQFIKEAVLESMSSPLELGLQFERKSFQLLFATPDAKNGIRARLDRAKPLFE